MAALGDFCWTWVYETNLNFRYQQVKNKGIHLCYVNFKSWFNDTAFIFSDFFGNVQIRPEKIVPSSTDNLTLLNKQFLWPSQNIWTLRKIEICPVAQKCPKATIVVSFFIYGSTKSGYV